MLSLSAAAQENAEVSISNRYTSVVSDNTKVYPSKRPPVAERLFDLVVDSVVKDGPSPISHQYLRVGGKKFREFGDLPFTEDNLNRISVLKIIHGIRSLTYFGRVGLKDFEQHGAKRRAFPIIG